MANETNPSNIDEFDDKVTCYELVFSEGELLSVIHTLSSFLCLIQGMA